MQKKISYSRVGVYVDVSNMYLNGGQRMRYEVLREFACRDDAEPVRLNAYVSYDAERAGKDHTYRDGVYGFHSALRDIGFKVIIKEIRWYVDENGNRYGKADSDLDLGIDCLLQSQNLDRILIASGDGDFVRVIQALQNRGIRVEAVALENVSRDLRQEVDLYLSGYLIPNLIPMEKESPNPWGEIGSRVRGWCYWHHATQSFGFIRYLKNYEGPLWLTDTRNPSSPYGTAFCHDSQLPPDVQPTQLPSRSYILEFELAQSERGIQAVDMELICKH